MATSGSRHLPASSGRFRAGPRLLRSSPNQARTTRRLPRRPTTAAARRTRRTRRRGTVLATATAAVTARCRAPPAFTRLHRLRWPSRPPHNQKSSPGCLNYWWRLFSYSEAGQTKSASAFLLLVLLLFTESFGIFTYDIQGRWRRVEGGMQETHTSRA